MIKWLNKISSPLSNESSSPRGGLGRSELSNSSPRSKWTAAYASDPTEWERIFESKWRVADEVIERKLSNVEHDVDYDEMTIVLDTTTCMCTLLMLEVNSQPEPSIGPILDRFFTEQILEKTLDWAIQLPALLKPSCQLGLVRIYENIVSESHSQNHCILVHKPILNPLLRLCEWSRRVENYWSLNNGDGSAAKNELSATDKHFVMLLNQICTKLAEDRTLLHFFFSCANGSEQFIVFTQLITFLYESNDVGQLARDAVLLILSVSADNEQISTYIAKRTAFCPVVATGLSGRFSQLPRSILGDGGERLVDDEYSDSLADYHSALLFCNAVAQTAHSVVVEQISQYFYSGFLISVVKPALLQDDRQYIAASLAYLQLCVETIIEPLLLKPIVKMVLSERDETSSTLLFDRLVQYTKGADKTAIVAISVIEAFVGLCCEDVMLAFVFRPLLTNHVTNKKTLSTVYTRQRCQELAEKYLECVPRCVSQYEAICSQRMLEEYMRETHLRIDARSEQCRAWQWKYDGVVENGFCLPAESDDDATCHVPFSRLSSSRSSMSIAAYGLNRHTTNMSHDFNIDRVCRLGQRRQSSEDDAAYASDLERDNEEEEIEEDSDFVLPPIDESAVSKAMTSSCIDYLHISAVDDFSESDESTKKVSKQSIDGDTDSDKSKSGFVLSGWRDVKDETTWRSLVDKQKIKGDVLRGKELVAFFDKKMEELRSEEVKEGQEGAVEEKKEIMKKKTGFSVYNFPERSALLRTIFEGIETLCENSLSFNIELISLVTTLACYPQSILAYYLFDPKEDASEKCLLSILQSVQTRIEIMAEGIEGFEGWIERALKSLELRKARIHRQTRRQSDDDTSNSFIGRTFGASFRRATNFRMHTHKHIDIAESSREDSTAKQTALAAIFLAHLSQILATIVLQQSLIK